MKAVTLTPRPRINLILIYAVLRRSRSQAARGSGPGAAVRPDTHGEPGITPGRNRQDEGTEATPPPLGGSDLDEFARKFLFGPLGMRNSTGTDGAPDKILAFCWNATERDMARLGLLIMNDGVWERQRRLSSGWIDKSTHPGLDLVIVVKNLGGLPVWEIPWSAMRPALVALDPVYRGDDDAFCRDYGAGPYAPDWKG